MFGLSEAYSTSGNVSSSAASVTTADFKMELTFMGRQLNRRKAESTNDFGNIPPLRETFFSGHAKGDTTGEERFKVRIAS